MGTNEKLLQVVKAIQKDGEFMTPEDEAEAIANLRSIIAKEITGEVIATWFEEKGLLTEVQGDPDGNTWPLFAEVGHGLAAELRKKIKEG